MAAIKTASPFDKGTENHKLFMLLKSGKETSVDQIREGYGAPLSNRRIGIFLREAEANGFRFIRRQDAELGRVYVMVEGTAAKGVDELSVEPRSYLARRAAAEKSGAARKTNAKSNAKTAKKAPAKKAAAKPKPATKTAAKAPVKRISRKAAPAKKVAKSAAPKPKLKKRLVKS